MRERPEGQGSSSEQLGNDLFGAVALPFHELSLPPCQHGIVTFDLDRIFGERSGTERRSSSFLFPISTFNYSQDKEPLWFGWSNLNLNHFHLMTINELSAKALDFLRNMQHEPD